MAEKAEKERLRLEANLAVHKEKSVRAALNLAVQEFQDEMSPAALKACGYLDGVSIEREVLAGIYGN